jgi:3',5'-cyclic AMP phosphodiesterase CpdA
MSVLLHLSDTHFGTERTVVLDALVTLSQQQVPDLAVLSGDITQRASRTQFAAAKAFMLRIKTPLLAIAGNHDIPLFNFWQRLLQPYARYSEAFGTSLAPWHVSHNWLVLCVNTSSWYRHKGGAVSAAQIEQVASRLRSAQPGQLRMVVVHQPIAVLRASERHNLLGGHAAAQHAWAAAGCDLVLGGHIHLPYVKALGGLARPMWAVQAGTAASTRVRDGTPNSVNLLRWARHTPQQGCQVEQWDYSATAQAFVCAHTTTLYPARTENLDDY